MTNKYTISVVANVTISIEIEAESTAKAKEVVDAMQHDELEQKPFRIYSIEEIDVNSDIKLLESGGYKSIIKKGVTIAWDAMEIARIGKDQLYAKAEETFMGAFGIEIEIFDMSITPESIEDNEVLWVCVPTDYKIEEEKQFLNKYKCPCCGEEWEDEWSCACNDRCPTCNKEIQPYESVELEDGDGK